VTRDVDARVLLDLADGLLRRADPATAGLWPRASALLALRALDATLRGLWERCGVHLEGCSTRTQLLCLRSYLEDEELAARAGHAWSALRRACHHHPYELAPTVGELSDWFAVVRELVQGAAPGPGRASAAR
jgi:hypothetical protein